MAETTTQFNERNQEKMYVVIGLDLGTSSTKVVVQTPYFVESRALLIPFGQFAHPSNQYLLPSKVSIDSRGVYSLEEKNAEIVFEDLKIRLLSDDLTTTKFKIDTLDDYFISSKELATAYLSLVLQFVRTWFLQTQERILSEYRLCWQLNIGIPTLGYDDKTEIQLFRETALKAWILSVKHNIISLVKVKEIVNSPINSNDNYDISFDDIHVIPEIAAEVTGYAKTPESQNGLHILIDIGASTLDIAGFVLGEDDDGRNKFSILNADLKWLGAYICHLERMKAVEAHPDLQLILALKSQDILQPLPLSIEEYFKPIVNGHIKESELICDFWKACSRVVHRSIKQLRKEGDPYSDKWKSGLPIFLCGGGKDVKIYSDVISNLQHFWTTGMNTQGFIITEITRPENLDMDYDDSDAFYRYAVAYGLSFPEIDIGKIIPPREISPIKGPQRSTKFDECYYISKDMV